MATIITGLFVPKKQYDKVTSLLDEERKYNRDLEAKFRDTVIPELTKATEANKDSVKAIAKVTAELEVRRRRTAT